VVAREMGALDYWVKSNLALEELAMRVGQAMKLEEIKNKTNEAVSCLVAALESGESEVLTSREARKAF